MEQLGRVNLLVGTNNCGKTSVLEAISILVEQGSWDPLWRSLSRRGETHNNEEELDIAHLFHGHSVTPGALFTIDGRNGEGGRRIEVLIRERGPKDQVHHHRSGRWSENEEDMFMGPSYLSMTSTRDSVAQEFQYPISRRGGISNVPYMLSQELHDGEAAVLFVTTEALSREQVSFFLEEAMLTPEEDTLLAALRTIEPGIERIAPVGARRDFPGRAHGGVAVKLAGQRVPIGNLGDGIWRLLGIALALVKARGGVLLVDEIDTGLHYSVLERMWRLVHETAKRLDVQVFATTHSRDCYESLAAIAQPTGHDVTIQRIERGKPLAVAFSEAEIVQAAQRGIEVR